MRKKPSDLNIVRVVNAYFCDGCAQKAGASCVRKLLRGEIND